jgi:hypothetical protein
MNVLMVLPAENPLECYTVVRAEFAIYQPAWLENGVGHIAKPVTII